MRRFGDWRIYGFDWFLEVLHSPRSIRGQVALGRALLMICGLIVGSTIWALKPASWEIVVLGITSVVLLGAFFLTPHLHWPDHPSRRPLLFPFLVFAGLSGVGLADRGNAATYTGLIVLCFVFVGLTQRPKTSTSLLPFAAGTWYACQDAWSAMAATRLIIAIVIWLVVGELLSYRTEQAAKDRLVLAGQAHTDSLTGLMNRRSLDERLPKAAIGDTIVMCDLDHFKALNDRDGHAAGDRVLAEFGSLLRESLRGQDVAARYGGEEFVLLLTDTSSEGALDVLARMRGRWAKTHAGITFSSGIAGVTETIPVRSAVALADEALYSSKAAGRDCDHVTYQQIVRGSNATSPAAGH
jgi:diguanylate cyclase (GGDEF)-like protein